MFGGRSIQLARIFGIRIGVDPSWFFILFLIIWSLSGYYKDVFPGQGSKAFSLAVASALLFFTCVILHELGHAVVAMRNGIEIPSIDLFLFGGVARMKGDTDSPGVEFRVAAAGPAVTLGIVLACFGSGALLDGVSSFWRSMTFDGARPGAVEAVLGYLTFINVLLLVFNLIPAYPLDGGRIARAIAWKRSGNRTAATRFAATLGRGFSYLLGALGVYMLLRGALVTGVWSIFIAFFLNRSARSQEFQTRITSHLEGLRVADVMDDEPVAVLAQTRLDRALDEFFLRYRWAWFPVIDPGGRLLGLVSRERVEQVPEELRAGQRVDEVMSTDPGGALRVRVDAPLEGVLGSDGLRTLGALMAVDAEGVLRGVVTLQRVRRALRAVVPVTDPPGGAAA